MEKEIEMEKEPIIIEKGGGAVNSVNGQVGDVVLTTSDIENTSDYQTGTEVESAVSTAIGDLAIVATTGDYDDLVNKPTIGDATLTVQKNGTTVGTFSANDIINQTINITVPVTAADVSALPDSTKYAASLTMSIDSSTYVVTTTLKDQDGNMLGTAQTIDLPLESVVVSGAYDSVNKKIVLTLQNGTTIDVPVADLVSGLQTEITSSNKLLSDLVDDTSQTNKFVTANEKTTWDGKQDTLTAGANISISAQNEISATDTTYSNFTGTDGTAAGAAGLVPAPATTDAGKYLKADGTWDSVQAGPTIVQTIGTSQSDVMSQDATTKLVFPSNDRSVVKIGPQAGIMGTYSVGIGTDKEVGNNAVAIGRSSSASPNSCIAIGSYATMGTGSYAIAIGASANCAGAYCVSIGNSSKAISRGVSIGHNAGKGAGSDSPASYSICLGEGSLTTSQGEMNIADYSTTPHGYNDTNYRLITGVHDPVNAHDAATKGYVDSATLTIYAKMADITGVANNIYIYKDSGFTTKMTGQEFGDAISAGKDIKMLVRNATEVNWSERNTIFPIHAIAPKVVNEEGMDEVGASISFFIPGNSTARTINTLSLGTEDFYIN